MFCLWVSADRREENSHGKWGVTERTHRCGNAERGHHRPCELLGIPLNFMHMVGRGL